MNKATTYDFEGSLITIISLVSIQYQISQIRALVY